MEIKQNQTKHGLRVRIHKHRRSHVSCSPCVLQGRGSAMKGLAWCHPPKSSGKKPPMSQPPPPGSLGKQGPASGGEPVLCPSSSPPEGAGSFLAGGLLHPPRLTQSAPGLQVPCKSRGPRGGVWRKTESSWVNGPRRQTEGLQRPQSRCQEVRALGPRPVS